MWPWRRSERNQSPAVPPSSESGRRLNQQARVVAAAALGEPVEAATRCEHVMFETAHTSLPRIFIFAVTHDQVHVLARRHSRKAHRRWHLGGVRRTESRRPRRAGTRPDSRRARSADPDRDTRRRMRAPWSGVVWRGRAYGRRAICGLAGAGEVLSSRTLRDLSAGSGLVFENCGPQRLKGLAEEMEVFRVSHPGGVA
jgi:hypothetical protein